jgi:hypothetical protein
VEIKGAGATVTYDGATLKIKHRGFGWVSAPVHQIVGVDLQLPGFLSSGKLTISTLSATRQGMMPNHPWRVLFTGKQLAEFQALHEHLMAAIRR